MWYSVTSPQFFVVFVRHHFLLTKMTTVFYSVVTCTLRGVLFSPVLSPLSRLVGVVDKVVTCTLRALGVDGVTMSLPSPEGSAFDSVLELFVTVVTSTLLGCGFPSLAVLTKPCPGVFPG